MINLARIAYVQDNPEQAQMMLEECLVLFGNLEDAAGVASTFVEMGRVAQRKNDMTQATACIMEGLAGLYDIGLKRGIAEGLEGLAGIAATIGQAERASRLFGAADALRQSNDIPLPPVLRGDYDRGLDATHAQLNADAFAAAWASGRAMTIEQAVAYALEEG